MASNQDVHSVSRQCRLTALDQRPVCIIAFALDAGFFAVTWGRSRYALKNKII